MFDSIFNLIFGPLINWNPSITLIIIAFLMTLIITLAYKFLTNQEMMKSLKEEMNGFKKQMKEHKDDSQKVMEIQKQALEKNMKYMMHSFKPTLFTIIPILIIFGWLSATLSYEPLLPDTEFPVKLTFDKNAISGLVTLTSDTLDIKDKEQTIKKDEDPWFKKRGMAGWDIKGEEGQHEITIIYNKEKYPKNILITNEWKPVKSEIIKDQNSDLKKIEVGNPFRPFLGLKWFWVYIITSIIFSMVLRKSLKIH